ncbi:hypothetical protein GJ496_001647 [Pomphorhynchus laevis]|nr:hypothetical protein GJ496_001647 [Pomphorhynchus laevis]
MISKIEDVDHIQSGMDFKYRELIADQYHISVTYKPWLRAFTIIHLVLAISVFLYLIRVHQADPHSKNYFSPHLLFILIIWSFSCLSSILGLFCLRKNQRLLVTLCRHGNTIFGLLPLFWIAVLDVQAYWIFGLEALYINKDLFLLIGKFAFVIFGLNLHVAIIYFSSQLQSAWTINSYAVVKKKT